MKHLYDIAKTFALEGKVLGIKTLGAGFINDTYVVSTSVRRYILQRKNHNIFPDVPAMMDNIARITAHLKLKVKAMGGNPEREVLTVIPTNDGGLYYHDGKNFWAVSLFIEESVTHDKADTPRLAYMGGCGIGRFQAMLADIPVELGETIKDFHNMEFRLQQLRDVVAENKAGRLAEVQWLVDELEARAEEMCKGERLHREGKLPKRICHCDTKVDNILFDKEGNVLCVIDLDTVMPNFIFSDFGDYLRSAANTGKEDDKDLDNVNFNMEIFKSFTKGYLKSAVSFITPLVLFDLYFKYNKNHNH